MTFYVYIIYNIHHDIFYIGSTHNLQKRITEHKTGKGNYTSRYNGYWCFLYYESFPTRSEAMRREKEIKSWKSKTYTKKFIREKRRSAG